MKKNLVFAAVVALCGCLIASVDVMSLANGESLAVTEPAKVVRIEALSSVADGTAQLKAEKLLFDDDEQTVRTVTTNLTYTSISTNAVGLCTTNVTAFDQAPYLPPDPFLLSYVTNTTVTTVTVTNLVPVIEETITNAVGSLVCSDGFAAHSPTNCYLVPGDRLFFTGTAVGRVTLVLER